MFNVTGKSLSAYLQEKLFNHLGITDYHWDVCAEGYEAGGWGLYMKTEDLAKMGQFFLQKGVWNGVRLLNEEWMEMAMSPQIYQNGKLYPHATPLLECIWKRFYDAL